jgi:glutamate synthase (NADPH/NADH) large chain
VVILGGTGRNFAAGMSGGIAYVLDPEGHLPKRLNREMVELEALDDEDVEFLLDRITRHRAETGSAVAARLLADIDAEGVEALRRSFAKVMPTDYKRVLEAQRRARETGEDELAAVMAAAQS